MDLVASFYELSRHASSLRLLHALNYQHHLSCKLHLTSLASNSTTNLFSIGFSCPPFTPQRWFSILVIFTTSVYVIASASLTKFPLPTSYQQYSCISLFLTCWPFSLEFSLSSFQLYRLLHCLQIQSKNSPFPRGKHL